MMNRYAMIGLDKDDEPFATMGVTIEQAHDLARCRNLDGFQVFPQDANAPDSPGMFFRRREGDRYVQGETKEFAARLSPKLARDAGYAPPENKK